MLALGLFCTIALWSPYPWPYVTFPTSDVVVSTLHTPQSNVQHGRRWHEGCQGSEAAPMSRGTTVPLSLAKNTFPRGACPHFPPEIPNQCIHSEVSTCTLPLPLRQAPVLCMRCCCSYKHLPLPMPCIGHMQAACPLCLPCPCACLLHPPQNRRVPCALCMAHVCPVCAPCTPSELCGCLYPLIALGAHNVPTGRMATFGWCSHSTQAAC